jgi:hypothetical protein
MGWLSDLTARIFKAIAEWIDRCLPKYEPGVWNDNNGIQQSNNCYNYGRDKQTNTFAQPARAQGIRRDFAWAPGANVRG